MPKCCFGDEMSYVRQKRIGNNSYAYEQESYRDASGRVHTRHVRYIGKSSGIGITSDSDRRIDETPKIVAIEKEMKTKKIGTTNSHDKGKKEIKAKRLGTTTSGYSKYQKLYGELGKNESKIPKSKGHVTLVTDKGTITEQAIVMRPGVNGRSIFVPRRVYPKKQFNETRFTEYVEYKGTKYYGLN